MSREESVIEKAVSRTTLVIDEQRVRHNIAFMQQKAKDAGVEFRPHFKTHQSREVGKWFSEVGVTKITVSSLLMADYFANDGWKDITVAFPLNIREMKTISRLAERIKLHVLVESVETVDALIEQLPPSLHLGLFIKVDIGYHRTGVSAANAELIDALIGRIESTNGRLVFDGFLGHSGHSYHTFEESGLKKLHEASLSVMRGLDERYRSKHPSMCISVGDTPCCSRMTSFGPANEIRPGNFVYYDLEQFAAGSCEENRIAVAVFCPVVAVHPERDEVVVYGGGVHFAKECLDNPRFPACYGMGVDYDEKGLGNLKPDILIKSLSQEHGIISVPPEQMADIKVGSLMAFVPVHSCMTADCLKEGITFTGKKIDHFSYNSFTD